MCRNFYVKINTEFNGPDAIRESVSWWQDDWEKLNHLWWVLNYYSEQLDPDRSLRACVEKQLDILAAVKTSGTQVKPPKDVPPDPNGDAQ